MGYIVSVYGENAFKKFLLPAMNNADYKMILYKDLFHLKDDLVLEMEVINHLWYFKKSRKYQLLKSQKPYFETALQNNDIVQLQLEQGRHLTLLIYQVDTPFHVYQKYFVGNLRTVSIGKAEENLIRYDYFHLVSGHHAVLQISQDGCVIQDLSSNGTFVNNIRVKKSQKLKFGDSIHILGLQIIYLGHILAIEQENSALSVNEHKLQKLESGELNQLAASFDKEEDAESAYAEKEYFHRVPRNMEKLEEEPVEIEEPPAPAQDRKQSVLGSIGPAFTMAIPMLLGSLMSIYASRATGSSSVFMYTGLVTAVSSAVIGSIWAAVNMRNARKLAQIEEEERQQAYIEYLEKNQNRIREKYEKTKTLLNERYLPAGECLEYNRNTTALWNRNMRHEDFLFHRVGIGRIPFPVPVEVPKERFRVHKDELALKPQDIKSSFETLNDVPVGVDFALHSLIGLIGGKNKEGALKIARNLLIQIAANDCYTDVKIAVVYHKENSYEEEYLSCVKWLPHVWSEDKKMRYVADTEVDAADVFYELGQILRERDEKESSSLNAELARPYYILFITDPQLLENSGLEKYAESGKPEYGFSTVLITGHYEDLPNACEFIIQNDETFRGYYKVTDDISNRVPVVPFDEVNQYKFERFARRLSSIEVKDTGHGGEIPNSLTFLDMYGVQRMDQLNVLERWRKNRTYESMKAMIGEKSGNLPCYLDIHEKFHGPHGLVAGTTGSGKSETLQTYILSLAMNYSPDDIGFFIIDYKGGGMANLFRDLPHTMGQISNLSGNQVLRAMVSIKSENRRRQRIFNEYGVNNINSYTRLYKNNETPVPVPHLFIIIDEFAELKREEPEFMKELISVAQVGRSLGVHLILATQKPSGTVDDNIWSNTRFRLCLRVQDKQDSNDMLHKPDAAYITQAGRGYLQVGSDEVYELFQSGWSGAGYDESDADISTDIAKMYTITGKTALTGNRMRIRKKENQKRRWICQIVKIVQQVQKSIPLEEGRVFVDGVFRVMAVMKIDYPRSEYNLRRIEDFLALYQSVEGAEKREPEELAELLIMTASRQGVRLPERKERTQLDALVDYLAELAKENGYTNPFTLWMPVLPQFLYLKELKGYEQSVFDGEGWPVHQGNWKLEAFAGLIDDPANQAQLPLILDFAEGGHHAVCGTVVSGKSTFLQTVVYSLVHSYTPEELNLYLLDFSSHMLGAFEGLSHVGGMIYENDMDKLEKFFNLIQTIMQERKEILKGGNYAQYVRKHGAALPAIVIVIDQFANFMEKSNKAYEDQMITIAKTGVGYGIYLLVSSAGFGMMEIPHRIADNIQTVVSLEMNDKYQYSEVLHVLRIPVCPEDGVKGRGLVNYEGQILEFQTALAMEAEDDFTRSEKIAAECSRLNGVWRGRKARTIPEIPENPNLSDFMDLEEVRRDLESRDYLPLGYNQENASVYSIDLRKTFCYLIQGREHTGRTNLLRILAILAKKKGGRVAIIDFSDELKAFAQKHEMLYLKTDLEIRDYCENILLPEAAARKKLCMDLMETDADELEIYERTAKNTRDFIFINDLCAFTENIYTIQREKPELSVCPLLENITEKGRYLQFYFFGCIKPEETKEISGYPVFANMLKGKDGVHLGGNVSEQSIFDFDYIPFTQQSRTQKKGIGMLPAVEGAAEVRNVVIPLEKAKKR